MCNLCGLTRRVRHVAAAVEFYHDHALELAAFHEVEDADKVDLSDPEAAITPMSVIALPSSFSVVTMFGLWSL